MDVFSARRHCIKDFQLRRRILKRRSAAVALTGRQVAARVRGCIWTAIGEGRGRRFLGSRDKSQDLERVGQVEAVVIVEIPRRLTLELDSKEEVRQEVT